MGNHASDCRDVGITDIGTWLHDWSDERVFRLSRAKKVFTPYEQSKKFIDEDAYEFEGEVVLVPEEFFELPNGDFVVAYKSADLVFDPSYDSDLIATHYASWNDIKLSYVPYDMKELIWERDRIEDQMERDEEERREYERKRREERTKDLSDDAKALYNRIIDGLEDSAQARHANEANDAKSVPIN